MAHLFSLPDELLVKIVTESSPSHRSLIGLGQSSRRLNNICIPHLLHRFHLNIVPHNNIITLNFYGSPDEVYSIDALRYAVFLKSMKGLHIQLHHNRCVEVIACLQRIQQVIGNLQFLGKLMVRFAYPCLFNPLVGNDGEDDLLEAWVRVFGGLLTTALERGAQMPIVRRGTIMTASYFVCGVPSKTSSWGWRRLLSLRQGKNPAPAAGISGPGWSYHRSTTFGKRVILPEPPRLEHATSTGQSLQFQSLIFLVPPFSHWVLSLLRVSNITTLSFLDIAMTSSHWTIILTELANAVPNLSGVSFAMCTTISQWNLWSFLRRCRDLVYLNLDEHTAPYFLNIPSKHLLSGCYLPLLKFDNLSSLSAPPLIALYLISQPYHLPHIFSRKAPKQTTPNLEQLTIEAANDCGSFFALDKTMTALTSCLDAQGTKPGITLHIDHFSNNKEDIAKQVEWASKGEGKGAAAKKGWMSQIERMNVGLPRHWVMEVEPGPMKLLGEWFNMFMGIKVLWVNMEGKLHDLPVSTFEVEEKIRQAVGERVLRVIVNGL